MKVTRITRIALAVCALAGSTVSADTFTVGEHGDYGMYPQTALSDAVDLGGGDHEIRIETGTYADTLYVVALNGGTITITGGWNATFTARDTNASLTTLTGTGGGSVLTVTAAVVSGILVVEGLTFSNTTGQGGDVAPTGTAIVAIRNSRFVNNALTMTAPAEAIGGGLRATLYDTSHLFISGCRFSGNTITATSSQTYGGGLGVWAEDDATFDVIHSTFTGNALYSPAGSWASGAGLHVLVRDNASGKVEDCLASGNKVASGSEAHGEGIGLVFNQYFTNAGSIDARRLRVWDNTAPTAGGAAAQLWIDSRFDGVALLSDSVVAAGDHDGIRAEAYDSATLRFTNVTIADHADTGMAFQANDSGHSSIHNTVFWGNSTNFSAIGTGTGSSDYVLVASDPNFRDAAARDYRIEDPSPAEDAGTPTPPAGLRERDAAGCPRVSGSAPDIGAYELGSLFGDGYESGDVMAWTTIMPG